MNITDFDIYKNLLKEKSGLSITPEKAYLLESRLNPVAREFEFENLDAMGKALQGVPNQKLVTAIVEAMTTNETSFFRDNHPFERFSDVVLPALLEKRVYDRKMKIWCAAASSGQEPYSLAMMMRDQSAKLSGWDIKITATDISREILDQAATGIYSQFEVQRGLPITMLMNYFTELDDNKWQLKEDIRKMIKFSYFNLLDSMAGLGKFDVIFCRNVLIYFDGDDKKRIMENMAKQLVPDGFLFLGGAETVIGITEAFLPMPGQRGIYVLKDSPHLTPKDAA